MATDNPKNTTTLDDAFGVTNAGSHNVSVVSEDLRPIRKAELDLLASNTITVESDPFKELDDAAGKATVTPTYNPVQLALLTHNNNTLLQCIQAMVVNVDGTGHAIVRRDGEDMTASDEKASESLGALYREPYPGVSFTTMRKALRNDLESVGVGYLEVLRNVKGDITFLKHADAKLTRRLKADAPTVVTRELVRGSEAMTVKESVVEARYVMVVGTVAVYFKEFGASRDLDAATGEWLPDTDSSVEGGSAKVLATELLAFTNLPDILTLYGVPRWINQLPSIMGSRKSEEYNLDFFNRGGVPPAMIIVSGGTLDNTSRDAITNYLASKATLKQRMVMIEVQPSSGSLTSSSPVKVTVERFGAEKQNDAMFMKYDEATGKHVRKSFRLPPLFLGLSEDYNFASAYASYMVAEAQVFKPERDEFDEILNLNISAALSEDYTIKSNPLSVKDIESQLKALELAKDVVSTESFITELNTLTALSLSEKDQGEIDAAVAALKEKTPPKNEDDTDVTKIIKFVQDDVLLELAQDWVDVISGDKVLAPENEAVIKKLVDNLDTPLRKLFDGYVAQQLLVTNYAPESSADLIACASDHQ